MSRLVMDTFSGMGNFGHIVPFLCHAQHLYLGLLDWFLLFWMRGGVQHGYHFLQCTFLKPQWLGQLSWLFTPFFSLLHIAPLISLPDSLNYIPWKGIYCTLSFIHCFDSYYQLVSQSLIKFVLSRRMIASREQKPLCVLGMNLWIQCFENSQISNCYFCHRWLPWKHASTLQHVGGQTPFYKCLPYVS